VCSLGGKRKKDNFQEWSTHKCCSVKRGDLEFKKRRSGFRFSSDESVAYGDLVQNEQMERYGGRVGGWQTGKKCGRGKLFFISHDACQYVKLKPISGGECAGGKWETGTCGSTRAKNTMTKALQETSDSRESSRPWSVTSRLRELMVQKIAVVLEREVHEKQGTGGNPNSETVKLTILNEREVQEIEMLKAIRRTK